METTRREVTNSSIRVPSRPDTRGHQSSSASFAEWEAPPCLLIEAAFEIHHLQLDWVQQRGTVVQYRVDSGMQALPDGKLFSPGLVTNGGRGVTKLRGRTSVRTISVARRHAAQTAVDYIWTDIPGIDLSLFHHCHFLFLLTLYSVWE